MRVTIHTELEPLAESRPFPPLPLYGPIPLEVAAPALSLCSYNQTSAVPVVPTCGSSGSPSFAVVSESGQSSCLSPGFLASITAQDSHLCDVWPVRRGMTNVLRHLCFVAIQVVCVIVSAAFAVILLPQLGVSHTCTRWSFSGNALSESCPQLDLGIPLLESAARQGDVDFMARGLIRTSLALYAKRVMEILCLPGA
ncbi:hypothetical protein B0H19DRAFT_1086268 [Mycena capillaripes]|nr:hypothetical protein B0H19DRAFT_1086268 [Mycena capillaripes]